MGSSSTAARPPRRAPTSRPTGPASMTTTSPKAPASRPGTSPPLPRRRGDAASPQFRTGGRWTATPTSGGSPGTTSRPGARRAGCAPMSAGCGSSRSWSTARRPGPWPRPCTRRSPPPTTPPRTGPRSRSSAGSPSTPPPGSGRVAGRCRCRSSSSRRRWCGTTPPAPATRTATSTCRSTPASSPPARWRGLHSVGVVDSIEAINGIGHAAVMCDPEFRADARRPRLHPRRRDRRGHPARAVHRCLQRPCRADQPEHRPLRSPVAQRAPRAGARPGAAARLGPPRLGDSPTRQGRPRGRRPSCGDAGSRSCASSASLPQRPMRPSKLGTAIGRVNRDAVADLVLSRLGARRSTWNAADIRGEVERIVASLDIVATDAGTPRARRGPHRPHRRPVRAAPGPRRRTRARPRAHLADGCSSRGRPRHPTRRPRRARRHP